MKSVYGEFILRMHDSIASPESVNCLTSEDTICLTF